MKHGHNNRGYKMPEAQRWGIRRWWDPRWTRYNMIICWHAEKPKESEYLIASHLTRPQAEALLRTLKRGALGQ